MPGTRRARRRLGPVCVFGLDSYCRQALLSPFARLPVAPHALLCPRLPGCRPHAGQQASPSRPKRETNGKGSRWRCPLTASSPSAGSSSTSPSPTGPLPLPSSGSPDGERWECGRYALALLGGVYGYCLLALVVAGVASAFAADNSVPSVGTFCFSTQIAGAG